MLHEGKVETFKTYTILTSCHENVQFHYAAAMLFCSNRQCLESQRAENSEAVLLLNMT